MDSSSSNQGGSNGSGVATEGVGRGAGSSSAGARSGPPGIRLGRWEIRPDNESWMVGRYNDRDARLKGLSTHHYLGDAGRKLLNLLVRDGFRDQGLTDLEGLIDLVEGRFRDIMVAFGRITTKEYV